MKKDIFTIDFRTACDWRIEDLQEALKQIDEAREIVIAEMKEWKEERAKELTQEINSLIQQIGEEGYYLYIGDTFYTSSEIIDECCVGEVTTKLV